MQRMRSGFEDPGNTKIRHPGRFLPVHQDIAGFYIPVDQAQVVGIAQGMNHRLYKRDHLRTARIL